jgi:PAS domain S-box-containing protein
MTMDCPVPVCSGESEAAVARRIQILHVENDPRDRELVRTLLTTAGLGCRFGYAQTWAEFMNALSAETWDVILANYALPAFDGCAALDIARKVAPQVPFLFLSAVQGEEVAVETVKRGATDYVVKQRMERLVPAVRRALVEAEAKRRFQQVEEKLNSTEQRFRLLIESIREYAIFMVDAGGTVISWNLGAKRIFGYSEQEVLGTSILPVFSHDGGGKETYARLVHTAQRCGHAEEDLGLIRKDGSSFCGTVLFTTVYEGHPGLQGFAVITRDITERKRAPQELEDSRQERARMQDRFLSHVSHELRTPLTSIVDFASLMLEGMAGTVSADQRTYLGIVLQAANRLAEMVNSLLDLSRSEWHQLPVTPECVILKDLVGQVCTSFRPAAATKWISLQCHVPAKLPPALADPARITQVLTNLIDNAIKYGRSGGAVEVTAHYSADEPDFLRVAVQDDGPGIPAPHVQRIFERFYRVSDGPDTNPGGLGLGLHITRELVRAHGGELRVDSSMGERTTFHFTLPIFSLQHILTPVLSAKNLALGKLTLITIALPVIPNCSAVDMGRYLRSVREVLQGCIHASEDIILPHLNISGLEGKFHVVAFVEAEGASAMMARFQEHLGGSIELLPLEGQFEVSSQLVDFSSWDLEDAEQTGARLADELGRWIGLTGKTGEANEREGKQNHRDRGQPGTLDGAGDQVASARL